MRQTLCISLLMVMPLILLADKNDNIALSDHFDGKLFHNPDNNKKKSLLDVLRWRFTRTSPVEEDIDKTSKTSVPPKSHAPSHPLVTFVGHASFLLQGNNLNVLTDPIWSERCSPISFIGPKRLKEPGIRFDDLPPIHAVVISHNHYDHMDVPTLVRLWQRFRPVFIVPLKNRHILADAGIGNIVELDWWSATSLNTGVTITAVPAYHWSGRMIIDRNESLWAGYVISFGQQQIFFAGDTGFSPHFAEIKKRFNNFTLALIPIGAHLPRWFMQDNHLSPEDAQKAAAIIDARHTIPMHFGTFALADDGFFIAEKKLRSLTNGPSFTILAVGENLRLD